MEDFPKDSTDCFFCIKIENETDITNKLVIYLFNVFKWNKK